MMQVKLQYNPYWVQTKLVIDGSDVAEDGRFERFQRYLEGVPLQTWLEPILGQDWLGLPTELEELNRDGLDVINIQFTGRQVDFDDLQAAAQRQRKDARFEFPDPKIVLKDENVDELLCKSMEKIRSPRFAGLLDRPVFKAGRELQKKYDNLEEEYAQVRNKEFRIVFAGLYSSGKSTLLNALMRKQLLPMADGACTAKVFRIEHKKGIAVAEMCCTAGEGGEEREVVPRAIFDSEAALLGKLSDIFPKKEDNEKPANPYGVEEVHLWTDLSHLYPEGFEDKFKLVLVDTPGTNNGLGNHADEEISHHKIATQAIASADKEMVILAVPAGNEQADSIVGLLDEIDEALETESAYAYDQRFLFVLNKCDSPLYASGESLKRKIRIYEDYISDSRPALRFPRIFPTAAQAALAIHSGVTDRGRIQDQHTRNLWKNYHDLEDNCTSGYGEENYFLEQYASVPGKVAEELAQELKRAEDENDVPRAVLIHSGLPSLERSIQAYIARYAYPLKVQGLLKTFYSIFTETKEWNETMARIFEDAGKKLEKAGEQKKEKEMERGEAEKREVQLQKAERTLDGCIEKINGINFDQDWINSLKLEVNKKTFGPIWDKLGGNGVGGVLTFNNRAEADKFGRNLAGTFEDGVKEANQEMAKVCKVAEAAVKEIFQEGNHALEELKESGALDLDGFDFTQTVAFHQIKGALQVDVKQREDMVENPLKRQKFKPWQIFELIGQLFAPAKIQQTTYTVDVTEIKNKVRDLQKDFDDSCDKLSWNGRDYIKKQKADASARIVAVKDSLTEVNQALAEAEERIEQLKEDQKECEQERKQLEEDGKFLDGIQDILKDCLPLSAKEGDGK